MMDLNADSTGQGYSTVGVGNRTAEGNECMIAPL